LVASEEIIRKKRPPELIPVPSVAVVPLNSTCEETLR